MPRFAVNTSKGTIEVLSQGEMIMCKVLDKTPHLLAGIVGYPVDVISWEYEPVRIPLTPEFTYDGKVYHESSYTPDFVIQTAQGFTLYVEIKGWNTFRREEEQVKEKDFIYKWILPNWETARYTKLILRSGGLVREYYDRKQRSENIINKSKIIRTTWTQIGHMLKGKKHEKVDLEAVLKSASYYRKNFRVSVKKDFIRVHQKELKLLLDSENPSGEACYNQIKEKFVEVEDRLKGDFYKPIQSGAVKYDG